MKFPRNNKELDQIFLSASSPEIHELGGEYLVDMLTLPASRRLFPDSKIFYSEDGKPAGHNRLFNTLTWGILKNLGRFNLLLGKKLLFLGYFSLSKKRGGGL
jgi:hypothetical protein